MVLKDREKGLTLVAVLSVILLLIAILGVWCYHYTHFTLYGLKTDIFADELNFNGREISDYDTLCSYLRRFKNLKTVNLGTFPIEAEKSTAFKQSFPSTKFIYHTVVNIEGQSIRTDATSIDLSDHGYSDQQQFIEKLSYLPNLRRVVFGKVSIPHTQKEQLESAYPDVDFEAIGSYEIYGKNVLENTEKLDLRDVELDASLYDQLALLPQLRFVDLHDQMLSKAERISLAQQFPDVSFGWTVHYNGETYDSSITTLDISGRAVEDLDALREAVAMLPDLKVLDMCDCTRNGYRFSNEEMQDLQDELKDIKVVWRVFLGSRWSLRTDAVAFSVLIIHYDYPRMHSGNLEVLKYCKDLVALDLGHQSLTDISFIGENFPELRLLILADNRIWDLSPLSNLKHLHYLEVFLNRISDISPLASCHELVDLNISYNPISDIEPILNAPMMERIWLEATYVGYNGLSMLQETYPDATIVRYGSGSVDQGWRWGNARYEQMMDMWFNDYYGDEFSKYDDKAIELGLRD